MKLPPWRHLLLLYGTFFKIAALVVGGGLAMLPVIERVFVDRKRILTREELLDMVALTQTVPGIVAVNAAVYVGTKVAGFAGAAAAALGAVTPSFLVILTIAIFFPHLDPQTPWLLGAFAGVRACVTGLILFSAIRLARRTVKGWFEAAAGMCFLIAALAGVHPAALILTAIPLGALRFAVTARRMKRAAARKEDGSC